MYKSSSFDLSLSLMLDEEAVRKPANSREDAAEAYILRKKKGQDSPLIFIGGHQVQNPAIHIINFETRKKSPATLRIRCPQDM